MPKALIIAEKIDHIHYCIAQWLLYKGIEVETANSMLDMSFETIKEYQIIVLDKNMDVENLKKDDKIIVITDTGRKRDDIPVAVLGNQLILYRNNGLYMLFRILEHLMLNKGLLDTTPRNIDFSTVKKP